jgi:antitoxin YefM
LAQLVARLVRIEEVRSSNLLGSTTVEEQTYGYYSGYNHGVKTVALGEAKDKLSALVDEAEREHEIIRITRHGRGAAVLMSEDDLESLHETLFWLSQPGIREDLADGKRAVAEGQTVNAKDARARYGLSES